MTKSEQETIIRWDSEDNLVTIYTCHQRIKNRCQKAGFTRLKVDKNGLSGKELAWHFEIPLRRLGFTFRKA